MEVQSRCCLPKHVGDSELWSAGLPQGLNMEVSHHPITMRSIVNLVIAMERFKTDAKVTLSSEFRDEDLLSIMLESAVEEHFVLDVDSKQEGTALAERGTPDFSFLEEQNCSVTDADRTWVWVPEAMELHAVRLQTGSSDHKVHLNMSLYVNPLPPVLNARPVALGIKGTDFYMACSKQEGKPTLTLEKVKNKDLLKSITSGSELERFLFYRQDTGVDRTTMMSASCKNWFISTAVHENAPVVMRQYNAPQCNQTFTVHNEH
ncbi:interleukin-1 beta [Aplochiton taeniatus]